MNIYKSQPVSFTFVHAKGDPSNNSSTSIEHSYMTHDDTPWMPIMLQFAAFLEGCGYVGVYQRVQWMIEEKEAEEDDWK
jgi:hypothetical protein